MQTTTEKIQDLYRKDIELNDKYRRELHETLDADLFLNKMQEKRVWFREEITKILSNEKQQW